MSFRRPVQGTRRRLHLQSQCLYLSGEMGGAELRDHLLRQHRVRHADSLPVRHNGRLDADTVLGKTSNSRLRDGTQNYVNN